MVISIWFCVGDRFYLCENKILCEYDYEERMVFANMVYNPPSIAHIKRQTSNLPPPGGAHLLNGSSQIPPGGMPGASPGGGLPGGAGQGMCQGGGGPPMVTTAVRVANAGDMNNNMSNMGGPHPGHHGHPAMVAPKTANGAPLSMAGST
ncbi:uncharacterized protein [Hetaerina americana]|uniref:uncharacterized protein n=1 Tax=Hetaerina americana TaxID=62018 RepID=UPI003A7F41D9